MSRMVAERSAGQSSAIAAFPRLVSGWPAFAALLVASACRRAERAAAAGRRRAPGAPARHRALRRLRHARDRPEQPRLRAAVSALDRWRGEAALDLAAARHRHRRLGSRRLGLSRGHAVLEGVRLRRPAGRDPHASSACPTERGATPPTPGAPTGARPRSRPRRGRAAPSPSAAGGRTRSRRQRLQGLPRGAAARRCSASACSSSRPTAIPARCTPSRSRRPASTSPYLVAGGAPRRAAGARCSTTPPRIAARYAGRAGGARLPARQLRPLPQRRRQAARTSGSSCATCRRPGRAGVATTVGSADQGPGARASPRTPCSAIDPGHPERSGLVAAHGLALGGAADAAARHRAGRRARRST